MQYSITRIQRAISASGIGFDQGSVYDRLENTPVEIADWAKHGQEELIEMLHLGRPKMPIYRLERQFQWWRNGNCIRTSCEVEYGIASLTRKDASPLRLLKIRRCHWGIETGLHYRRDVTFREDAMRMTIGNLGKVMASINNLVLALIRQANFLNSAQARRWFAAHISEAFALLTIPFFPTLRKP